MSKTRKLVQPSFDCIIGVDQTGAVRGGKPKPLPCTVLLRRSSGWDLFSLGETGRPLSLPNFSAQSIAQILEPYRHPLDANVGILVDCVLGLPWRTWKQTGEKPGDLRAVIRHCVLENAYGKAASETFFGRWKQEGEEICQRECERVSGSNSVFLTVPHQKNIQTGTYRIWRDLALAGDEDSFSFWPFDPVDRGRPWIFEGYPSFYWKHLFGKRVRKAASFPSVLAAARGYGLCIRAEQRARLSQDPDLADAAVLALAGLVLQHRNLLFSPFPGFGLEASARTEGWIAGVTGSRVFPWDDPLGPKNF